VTNLSNDEKNNEIVTVVSEKAATETSEAVSMTILSNEENLKENVTSVLNC
jgi:hypothetical protein